MLLVQLLVQPFPVVPPHILLPVLLGLPPLIASLLLLLYPVFDMLFFQVVPLVVELRVVFGNVGLIIEEHLVVLN
jgi:hypothetical protein